MIKKKIPDKINIGTVTGPVGLKGELSIFHTANAPDMLMEYESLIIGDNTYAVDNVRYRKKTPILKLSGIDSREAAENLAAKDIYIYAEVLPDLPKGSYYIKDLTDICVETSDGKKIGIIKEIITGTSQDTYIIETPEGKKLMLPAVTEFILEIDIDRKIMKVDLPKGIEETLY